MEKERSTTSVLRRKAKKPSQSGNSAGTVGRLLSLAFERSARDALGLSFAVEECRYDLRGISDLTSDLPDRAMWCMLENGSGGIAALTVDPQLLAGLVEFQTLGCVLKMAAEDRRPTRVDGALVMAVADEALDRLTRAEAEGEEWLCHYRYGAMTESKRALILSLVAEEFHFFRLRVALEGGAKSGEIRLAFPKLPDPVEDHETEAEAAAKQAEFQAEVRQAPAQVTAVLARIQIPYEQLSGLSEGDVLELPLGCLRDISLEVGGHEPFTKATLGQMNGLRAARVALPGEIPKTERYDVLSERPETPDKALLKETEAFLPPTEEATDTPQKEVGEILTAPQGDEEEIEDFSDLDELDQIEAGLPQLAAG